MKSESTGPPSGRVTGGEELLRPRKDITMSWHWYTAATAGIRTHDLAITVPLGHHLLIDTVW